MQLQFLIIWLLFTEKKILKEMRSGCTNNHSIFNHLPWCCGVVHSVTFCAFYFFFCCIFCFVPLNPCMYKPNFHWWEIICMQINQTVSLTRFALIFAKTWRNWDAFWQQAMVTLKSPHKSSRVSFRVDGF